MARDSTVSRMSLFLLLSVVPGNMSINAGVFPDCKQQQQALR